MTLPDFVTAAQLADFSKGQLSASDPRIAGALAGASRAIRNYCGWHIFPRVSETLLLDSSGGRELELPSMHVTDIASVRVNGTELAASVFEDWSELGSIRLHSGGWPDRYRSVSVTLTHGYDAVPDIAETLKAIVTRELSSPSGATREQAGQVAVSWAITSPGVSGGLAILGTEYAVLDSYRIVGA